MSKKSKEKNNLKLSILLLILLLIVLTASTYAWFTANQTVTVESIDVNIEAKNGLQISTNAVDWKSIITNADITTNAYTGNTNQLPTSMEPVSTIGEIDATTGYMKMYYGKVESAETGDNKGKDVLTATAEAEPAGTDAEGKAITPKFVSFDIFLRVTADTKLKMTNGSKVVKKDTSTDNGIKQASRVAFCVEGTVDAGAATTDMTALKGAKSFLDTGKTVYIWEPNANLHTSAAVNHASNNYGITTLTTDGAIANKVTYAGIKQAFTTETLLKDSYTPGDNFATITPDYITYANADGEMLKADGSAGTTESPAEQKIFSLTAGVTKVRVYMWIEGQDVDCENNASGTDISYNLQFTIDND